MQRWQGRVALVTGASSGIGRAVALRLGREGMRVAVAARREDRLAALQRQAGDAEVMAVPTDLRDLAAISDLFGAIRQRWGGVDVLVNNAGLGHKAPLMAGEAAHWREMLDVNVLALSVCTREAIQDMRARGDDGHVVHVSSMSAHRVAPGSGMYAATKHAVKALTEALRMELRHAGSDIRVSALSPGFVETEFAEHYHRSAEAAARTYGRYPVLQPDDVAEAVVWVLSRPQRMQVHDVLVRPTRQES